MKSSDIYFICAQVWCAAAVVIDKPIFGWVCAGLGILYTGVMVAAMYRED